MGPYSESECSCDFPEWTFSGPFMTIYCMKCGKYNAKLSQVAKEIYKFGVRKGEESFKNRLCELIGAKQ